MNEQWITNTARKVFGTLKVYDLFTNHFLGYSLVIMFENAIGKNIMKTSKDEEAVL